MKKKKDKSKKKKKGKKNEKKALQLLTCFKLEHYTTQAQFEEYIKVFAETNRLLKVNRSPPPHTHTNREEREEVVSPVECGVNVE